MYQMIIKPTYKYYTTAEMKEITEHFGINMNDTYEFDKFLAEKEYDEVYINELNQNIYIYSSRSRRNF